MFILVELMSLPILSLCTLGDDLCSRSTKIITNKELCDKGKADQKLQYEMNGDERMTHQCFICFYNFFIEQALS